MSSGVSFVANTVGNYVTLLDEQGDISTVSNLTQTALSTQNVITGDPSSIAAAVNAITLPQFIALKD